MPDRSDRNAARKAARASHPAQLMQARPWRELNNPEQTARWDALAQCAAQPNPFYESWYLLPSLREIDPQNEVKLLCLEVDGHLAGIMPIRHYPSYYGYPLPHFRNWVHDNCFCGQPLVAAGMEAHFWRAVLKWCDENVGRNMFLHLIQMPGHGIQHLALQSLLAMQERPAATVLDEVRAKLSGTMNAEEYFANSISSKKRKELRRQERRLGELGELKFTRQQGEENITEWTEDFLVLEAKGWKGAAGSSLSNDRANSALFRDALSGAAQRGRLERLSLTLSGQPIAMLATFVTSPGAYSFKTAFDEDYARFSPGVLLQRENLSILENHDIRWVDSCAVQDHKMIDHIWREKRRITRHSIAIGGPVRQRMFRLLARRETGKDAKGIT